MARPKTWPSNAPLQEEHLVRDGPARSFFLLLSSICRESVESLGWYHNKSRNTMKNCSIRV
jgi:hypothetical protein